MLGATDGRTPQSNRISCKLVAPLRLAATAESLTLKNLPEGPCMIGWPQQPSATDEA